MKIKIENPNGSVRFGLGLNGVKWASKMRHHYGYIQGTNGNDEDPIDVFIGENFKNNKAFVVNQGNQGMFDEHKILIGFPDINEAKKGYLSCYEKGWEKNILSIVPTNTKKLREWLNNGSKTEIFRGEI